MIADPGAEMREGFLQTSGGQESTLPYEEAVRGVGLGSFVPQ